MRGTPDLVALLRMNDRRRKIPLSPEAQFENDVYVDESAAVDAVGVAAVGAVDAVKATDEGNDAPGVFRQGFEGAIKKIVVIE